VAAPIERQRPIVATIDVHKLAPWIQTHTPWIHDARIFAERSVQLPFSIEDEDGPVSVAIFPESAGDEHPRH
jgi:hypothetical protein